MNTKDEVLCRCADVRPDGLADSVLAVMRRAKLTAACNPAAIEAKSAMQPHSGVVLQPW